MQAKSPRAFLMLTFLSLLIFIPPKYLLTLSFWLHSYPHYCLPHLLPEFLRQLLPATETFLRSLSKWESNIEFSSRQRLITEGWWGLVSYDHVELLDKRSLHWGSVLGWLRLIWGPFYSYFLPDISLLQVAFLYCSLKSFPGYSSSSSLSFR